MADDLLEQARFERNRRADRYPKKIAEFPTGPNGALSEQAEKLCIDYQCWVAIAEFIESGRFYSFAGGSNPEAGGAPIVSWPQLEQAAKEAVDRVTAKLDRLESPLPAKTAGEPSGERGRATPETPAGDGREDGPATQLAALRLRRSRLATIHRRIQLQRQTIEEINAEFRARRASAAVGMDGPPNKEAA